MIVYIRKFLGKPYQNNTTNSIKNIRVENEMGAVSH